MNYNEFRVMNSGGKNERKLRTGKICGCGHGNAIARLHNVQAFDHSQTPQYLQTHKDAV